MDQFSEGNKPPQESVERSFHGKDFAPIEHFLNSGSDDFKDTKSASLSWFIDQKKSGNLDPDLFKVPSVDVSRPETLAEVNKARREQRFKKKGLMPFIDFEKQNFLAGQGLNVGFVLGDVREDGTVDPKWQLILIEGDDIEVDSEELLQELALTEEVKDIFSLQLEDGKLFLALK